MKRFYSSLWMAGIVFGSFVPIFFGYLFFNGDTISYDYPLFYFYKQAIIHGTSVLINPYYLSGFPSYLSPVGSFIDPLNQLFLNIFSDSFAAYHARFFVSIFLGIYFSFAFARRRSFGYASSGILSLTYLVAQTLGGQTSGLINSGCFFVLPALLLLIDLFCTSKRFWWWVICGSFLLGYGWLAGFIQVVLYSVCFALCYALFRDWDDGASSKKLFSWKATIGLVLVAFISVCIAYPFLKDTLQFKSETPRVAGFGAEHIDGLQLGSVINFIVPDYLSIPFVSTDGVSGLYFGGTASVLALLALLHIRRKREVAFAASAYGASMLLLIPPLGLSTILQHLPVFSSFHTLSRILMPASFFVAYLSAYGYEALLKDSQILKGKIFLIGLSILASLIWIVSIILSILKIILPLASPDFQAKLLVKVLSLLGKTSIIHSFDFDHYRFVFGTVLSDVFSKFTLFDWKFALPLLFLACSLILLWLYRNDRISKQALAIVVPIMVSLNVLTAYAGNFENYVEKASLTTKPQAAQAILSDEKNDEGARLISVLTAERIYSDITSKQSLSTGDWVSMDSEILNMNVNQFSGIPRVDGYEPFHTTRQFHFFEEILKNENFTNEKGVSITESRNNALKKFTAEMPLLSSYHVGYIISGYPLLDPVLAPIEFTPKPPLQGRLYLYKNTSMLPIVYIPDTVKMVDTWNDGYFDDIATSHGGYAVVECEACGPGLYHQKGSVTLISHTNDRISFTTASATSSVAYVSISEAPLWSASIDGAPAKILKANYLMQAVVVPAGLHSVTFSYHSLVPHVFEKNEAVTQ